MTTTTARKSVMTLFSSPICIMSHCTRFVLHEKGIVADVEYCDPENPPADLIIDNPNGTLPTLIDRDLVLYDSRIIMEYFDERFPHPPLHQMDPVSRAFARMLIKRIDQGWYQLLDDVLHTGEKKSAKSRKMLRESLLESAPLFAERPFFMSEEFSLVDCVLAPLLWRMPSVGIDLTLPNKDPIRSYAKRLFERPAFKRSLSDDEKELGD